MSTLDVALVTDRRGVTLAADDPNSERVAAEDRDLVATLGAAGLRVERVAWDDVRRGSSTRVNCC